MYRILVVDDDLTSLFVAEAYLKRYNYEVMAVSHALEALSILDKSQKDENEKTYDVVLSDVHMPVMDGFELMRRVNTEFNIPVVLISADERDEVMQKGLNMGAPAYLFKPIKAHEARLMWQHSVFWKNKHKYGSSQANVPRSIGWSSPTPDAEDNPRERKKSTKIDWNSDLHNRFVEAMLILGYENAVPINIVQVMNVRSVTREQVASHMQKFLKFLDKVLNGETSLRESRHKWIDCNYHSSIVHGNPNEILTAQLQEKQRTGYLAAPIRASLPLAPFNEAEASSSSRRRNINMIPNTYASSPANVGTPTVPGLGGVVFQSAVNVATPAQDLGGVTFQRVGSYLNLNSSTVPQQNYYFRNEGVTVGANSNMFPSPNPWAPSCGTAANFSEVDNLNADLPLGNVQPETNIGGPSFPANVFGNVSAVQMNEQAQQLGGEELLMADHFRSWSINDNAGGSSIPEPAENSLPGNDMNLDQDWGDLLLNFPNTDDEENGVADSEDDLEMF